MSSGKGKDIAGCPRLTKSGSDKRRSPARARMGSFAESIRDWASYQLFCRTLKERLRAVRPFCALSPGLDFEYGHLIERLDDAARIMQPRANKAANGTASARVATGSSVG